MKIKEGYVLKKVAGHTVVVPCGNIDFDGIITLNESAEFIWNLLLEDKNTDQIVSALKSEYDESEENIRKDVEIFVKKLSENGILDE